MSRFANSKGRLIALCDENGIDRNDPVPRWLWYQAGLTDDDWAEFQTWQERRDLVARIGKWWANYAPLWALRRLH